MEEAIKEVVAKTEDCNDNESPLKVILDAVPEDRKEEVREALMIIREEMYSGPIPSPEALEHYEKIQPGAADRILKMAEKQQEHRMALETKAIGGQVDQSKRGQIFGFILVFVFVAIAVFFAKHLEMKEFAAILLGVTMVSVVALFVTGKWVIKKDLANKSKDQEQ